MFFSKHMRQLQAITLLSVFVFMLAPRFGGEHEHEHHHDEENCEVAHPCHLAMHHEVDVEACDHESHLLEEHEICKACDQFSHETTSFFTTFHSNDSAVEFWETEPQATAEFIESHEEAFVFLRGPPIG